MGIFWEHMKRKPYVPSTDYGKRNYELNKDIMQFGTYAVTLYRRPEAKSSSWFFRIYIKEEKRHYRQSLNTTDLNQAKFSAQDQVVKILGKVQHGQRLLDVSLNDLHRQYQVHMDHEVENGQISKNTWKSHRYRLRLGLEYLKSLDTKYPKALDTRLGQVDGEVYRGYLDWRLATTKVKGRTLRKDVVRDELLTIRKMFLYAKKEKLCGERAIPNWDFRVEAEPPKRERLRPGNRAEFNKCLAKWAMFESVGINIEKTTYHRMLTLSVIRLVEASGMRSGEVFGLKNECVQRKGDNILISILAETSKVRRSRDITVKSLIVDDWLSRWQRHKDQNDFFFSPFDTGKTSCRDTFYHQYKSFRSKLREVNLEWYDLYHCRHVWVTNRILAGEHLYKIAQASGTSTKEIESTYSHVITEETTKEFNKKVIRHFADGSHEVVLVDNLESDEMVDQIKAEKKAKRKR
jgi:integrase